MAKAGAKTAKVVSIVPEEKLIGCDFCMQFDMDEPHVVAATDNPEGFMEIKVTPVMDGGVVFQCPTTGKKLRIFARPLTDAGQKIIDENPLPTENK
jgi:hypothetical protein